MYWQIGQTIVANKYLQCFSGLIGIGSDFQISKLCGSMNKLRSTFGRLTAYNFTTFTIICGFKNIDAFL